MYTSFKDPTKTVKYVSEILEDGPVVMILWVIYIIGTIIPCNS